MPGKNIPLSVRISENDAKFLAELKIADAITPSEKMRALLSEARGRRRGKQDYEANCRLQQDLLTAFQAKRMRSEKALHTHSELVTQVTNWALEMQAFLMAGLQLETEEETKSEGAETGKHEDPVDLEALTAFEADVADRAFLFVDLVLRMAVTPTSRTYDPTVVRQRVEPITALCKVIES